MFIYDVYTIANLVIEMRKSNSAGKGRLKPEVTYVAVRLKRIIFRAVILWVLGLSSSIRKIFVLFYSAEQFPYGLNIVVPGI